MEHKIVEKPSFRVVGKGERVSMRDGENMRRIPQFWQECVQNGVHNRLLALADQSSILPGVTLGVCTDFAKDMSEFTYIIAAETAGSGVPDGLVEKTIPAATWAVFEGKGSVQNAIQPIWGYIMSEFFESSGFKHGDAPDLELYPRGDPYAADYQFEIWVPVVKG